MSVSATAKGVRIAPRKVNLVAGLVRGRTVVDALVILEHTPKRAAEAVAKVIRSAQANATNNHDYQEDGLRITELVVGHGPSMKRYRPAARGMALPYKLRSSHIKVTIDGKRKKPKTTSKKKAPVKPKVVKKSEETA
jgi:large subunit ribosomal protein L22